MTKSTIGLFGGSGFVGSVLANQLVAAGHAVRILTRRRANARELWLLPDTTIVEVDNTHQEQLTEACRGCDAIVNLVSILNERGDNGAGFRAVNVELPRRLVKAVKAAQVPHLVQFSALNADSFAQSYYLRTKGEAEKLLGDEQGTQLTLSIVRPSLIFGPHDGFTNRFANLLKLAPGIFPLAAADTRFQPVYVGDVAAAVITILNDVKAAGRRYDFGGPEVFTLKELVEYIADVIERPTRVIGLGPFLSSVQANVLEYVPGKPFSRDNLRSMEEDSVCAGANGIEQLGVTPTPIRTVVPGYLGGNNQRRRYYGFRITARRNERS